MEQRSTAPAIAAANQRAAEGRSAASERQARAPRVSEFECLMDAAGLKPGSPEYIKAARVKARLEEGAGGSGAGIEMSYDAEGRPVVNIGGKGQKLTEQQAKNTVNVTAAEQAQAEMDRLAKAGFDPTSAAGAAQVTAADLPIIGGLMPEEAQAQASANRNLSAGLNYARSGANITELEIENSKKALLPRYGDKPEVTAYKREARKALIESMKAGSPNVRAIVDDILLRSSSERSARSEGTPSRSGQGRPAIEERAGRAAGTEDPERAELEQLRAMKAARRAGP